MRATTGARDDAENVRVLVVEDNEIGLELTRIMAGRLGVQADGASDGHNALQMVRDAGAQGRPYALVLMDFMMPVVDGIEATRRLRQAGYTREALPVIALTAIAEPREISRFTAAGGQGYLSKPISIEKLSAVLDAWLPGDTHPEADSPARHSRSLLARYAQRKRATLQRIDQALALRENSASALEEIRDLLHKLAGTAGMFGDEELSALAAQCEQELVDGSISLALSVLERNRPLLGAAA